MSSLDDFDHLRIRLEDIKSATNNFGGGNLLSTGGGFGRVYKGELVHSSRHVMVAVKRLDPSGRQGFTQFLTEIRILSDCKHKNIVSLLGFSDEGGENILVYEYLPNKSLDKHLTRTTLSWIDRLSICIDVARGLEHLHNNSGTSQSTVLHCDIKSGNILLDTNWNAKISDFGLSVLARTKQGSTYVMCPAVGTPGYCDPISITTGFCTKESDVYSFGVVLFEVLFGRYGFEHDNDGRPVLSELAKRCYKEMTIHTMVPDFLLQQISQRCLDKFSTVAYHCLQPDRKERPQIAEIVKRLKAVRRYQVVDDILREKKLKSHSLFHLIDDPDMKVLMNKLWTDVKTFFKEDE